MVEVIDYPRTATFAWSKHKLPYLVSGTYSSSIDSGFSADANLELWSINQIDNQTPLFSLKTESKFNDLDWSSDNTTIAGALDNEKIEILKFNEDTESIESNGFVKNNKHTGCIKTITFNSKQNNLLLSGGEGDLQIAKVATNSISNSSSEIFIYDLNDIDNPDSLPMTPNMNVNRFETISSLAWNKSLSHVFAAAGNSSAVSIFDLKAKKEVIHLNYINPTTGLKSLFSVVEWHPMNSTRIATATSNNSLNNVSSAANSGDAIYIWDLRNSSTPQQTLTQQQHVNNTIIGHTDGILSLDWCEQDENFLLSSGRDNTVMLWNPESGLPLTKYPSRTSWCFKTKFAPNFPEIFATAALDGKIEVQTLQNIPNVLDEEENNSKKQESETDFWNNVSTEKIVEKATIFNIQAPSWHNNIIEPAAKWSFGGKLVSISSDGKNINITKPKLPGFFQDNKVLNAALQKKDFTPIINQRLIKPINDANEEDWSFIEKLNLDGKDDFITEAFAFDDAEEKLEEESDDFFINLENSFEPSGKFALKDDADQAICKHLINGDIKKAIVGSLEKDCLLEALVIALGTNDETLKNTVKNAYFAKHGSKSSLSRFLYSVSNSNSNDLVQNIKLSQWRYAVKSIYKFYSNKTEEKNSLLIHLGDRLLESGNRLDALTVYLAADSIDNVAGIWLKEFATNESKIKESKDSYYEAHNECLTEFVERFMALSKHIGTDTKITNDDLISKFLEFVALTTAAGDFDLAYKFLETLPGDNEEVNTEKQRVLSASGKSAIKQQTQTQTRANKYGNLPGTTLPSDNLNKMPTHSNNLPSSFQPSFGAQVSMPAVVPPVQAIVPPVAQNIATPKHASQAQPSRYAPQASTVPVPGTSKPYGVPQTMSAQAPIQPQVPVNPYATVQPTQPVFAHLKTSNSSGNLSNNPITNDPSSIPPPPIHLRSGQTPHLSKEANDGWNDLPLKSKDKPSRAKPVAVTPVAAVATQQATPIGLNNIRPPPNLSRTSSMMGTTMSAQNKSRSISGFSPKVPVNPYAPFNSGSNSAAASPPPAAMSNPYAPPVELTPSNVSSPPNPYGVPTNAVPSQNAPPVALKTSVGPPPVNARKKGHNEAEVANAGSLLNSIKSEPIGTTPTVSGVPTASTTAPQPAPAQTATAPPTANAGAIPEDNQEIIDYFQAELDRVTPLIPKEFNKQLKDCTKRLKILFEHLQKQDLLTQPTIEKLKQLIELMKAQNYDEALQIHVAIATEHAQEGGNWLTGVKRLVSIAKATV